MYIEQLVTVEYIEYQDFREKIDITRRYRGKAKVEIVNNRFIYIEKFRREN